MADKKKYSIKKLEYNVTHSCNLKCDFCDHLSPFFGKQDAEFESSISVERFRADMESLARYISVHQFLILGGEPLMNKSVVEYIRVAKETRIAEEVALVTNGFLLVAQPDELFELLDKIMITVYPSARLKDVTIEKIRERCKQHSVELEINHKPKFMMSILGSKNEDDKLVKNIFDTCSVAWKNRCFALHDGYLYRCSRAPFIAYKLKRQGLVDNDFSKQDGLKVEASEEFGEKIKAYVTSEAPLKSCSFCLGSVGKQVEHRQLLPDDIEAENWTQYGLDESIDHGRYYKKLAMLRLFGHR